jgi:hypothetical protein
VISHSDNKKLMSFSMMLELSILGKEPCENCGKLLGTSDVVVSNGLYCMNCKHPISL